MRNQAIRACQTPFNLVHDIDMIPVVKMNAGLERFFENSTNYNCDKCAFIVPVYEVAKYYPRMPINKYEIVDMASMKII